ncbi:MAG TPA: TolC family outer membrane protein [Casimicrobiaceae bacterium]|nr:TolC family outer membrane protein [Casimicrobiaceae bacterium]
MSTPFRSWRAALAVLAVIAAPLAGAEDLVQVYHEARLNDPTLAAAQANWVALQERLPQARALLLPNVNLTAAANANLYDASIHTQPRIDINGRGFAFGSLSVSASQPLYRYANKVALDQARDQVEQSDYTLQSARQDLILRVAQAYFDVLLAQFNVELAESQKAAVSEQLAQAKRNFEVGVATITDTNEAQARYDAIVAQEITARNDLDNRRTALRAIIGRAPGDLKRLGPGFEPRLPSPDSADYWVDRALVDNIQVKVAQYNFDIATLEVERQRAGHLPTLDLVGSFNTQGSNAGISQSVASESRQALVGLALTVPLYQGGFVNSKVREAIALQENARQNLEVARRNALFNAQTGYSGVASAVASVKAFEQAVVSAQTAYESNRTGQEVGVRTNLDVLNTQQQVFQTRRDLAQAYFNYLVGVLRLRSAIGTLSDEDVEDINRRLRG